MSSSSNELSAGPQALVFDSIQFLGIVDSQLPDLACKLFSPNSYPMGFLLFPLLSIELRLLIWEFVCCFPQKFTIFPLRTWPKGPTKKLKGSKVYENFVGFRCEGKNPGVLTTNRESRTISMSIYQQLLRITTAQTSKRYFNPSVDTIIIDFRGGTSVISAEEFAPNAAKSIQDLKLSLTCWGFKGTSATGRFRFCWNIEGCACHDKTTPQTLEERHYSAGLRLSSLFGGLRCLYFEDLRFRQWGFPVQVEKWEDVLEIRNQLSEQYKALKAKDPTVFRPYIQLVLTNGNYACTSGDTGQRYSET